MKIGVNYLTELVDLIQQEKVGIDFIKYPSVSSTKVTELMNITKQVDNKLLFHNTISKNGDILTMGDDFFIEQLDIEQTRLALQLSKNPYMSIHISDKNTESENKGKTEEELLCIIEKNAKFLEETFPEIKVFSIENREYATIYDRTDFLTKVFKRTGFKFLLDISHVKGAADKQNIDFYEYLKALPLEYVYETHLNGWKYSPEGKDLSHGKINDECYEALKYVLDHSNLEIITIEYGAIEINKKMVSLNNEDENMPQVYEDILEQVSKIQKIIEEKRK